MNKFNLDDLKTGHVVKFRNGEYGLVMCDLCCTYACDGIGVPNNGFVPFYLYDLDMKHKWEDRSHRDIMEVYNPSHFPNIDNLQSDCSKKTLVWKRESPKKMTLEQISEALGYEVEIVDG